MVKVEFKKVPGDVCTITRGGVTAKGTVLQCVLADKGEKLYFVSVPGQVGRTFSDSEIDVGLVEAPQDEAPQDEAPQDEAPQDEDFDPDLEDEPEAPKPPVKKSKNKKKK